MPNKIRKLSIGSEVKERFVYAVRDDVPFFRENKKDILEDFFLVEIVECENHFNLYLKNNDEVHLWKKEPKNQNTSIEFFLD